MGLLDNFVKSSIDGVVIELDKGNTPYVAGEKVMIVMNPLHGQILLHYNPFCSDGMFYTRVDWEFSVFEYSSFEPCRYHYKYFEDQSCQ